MNAQMFDIDMQALFDLRDAVGASQDQMLMAYNRALDRTTKHMYRVSVGMIIEELAPKSRKQVSRRVRPFIKRRNVTREQAGDLSSVKLWYGLNPFKVSELKGTLRQPRGKKQQRDPETGRFLKKKNKGDGATFSPSGRSMSAKTFPDSFIATRYGHRSIWIRQDGGGIAEARVDIAESVEDKIDDYIFENIAAVFMRYFEQDLRGRVAGNVTTGRRAGR